MFADGYAQAVTFGLLMARALDISIRDGVELAAIKLKRSNTLIGTALNLLTEDEGNREALKTSLGTLTRVLNEVNWATLSKGKPEAWLYFYRISSKSTTTACGSSPARTTRRRKSSRRW